jgi:hypothetical protein
MPTMHETYASLIHSIRDLEKVLGPAVAAQYSPPPGGTGEVARNGIPNPTLDTVIDPRRLALSEDRTTNRPRRRPHAVGGERGGNLRMTDREIAAAHARYRELAAEADEIIAGLMDLPPE